MKYKVIKDVTITLRRGEILEILNPHHHMYSADSRRIFEVKKGNQNFFLPQDVLNNEPEPEYLFLRRATCSMAMPASSGMLSFEKEDIIEIFEVDLSQNAKKAKNKKTGEEGKIMSYEHFTEAFSEDNAGSGSRSHNRSHHRSVPAQSRPVIPSAPVIPAPPRQSRPVPPPAPRPVPPPAPTIPAPPYTSLTGLDELDAYPAYYPDMSRMKAHKTLKDQDPFTFLIRPQVKLGPKAKVISVVDENNDFKHFIIKYEDDEWRLEGGRGTFTHGSFSSFIGHFNESSISAGNDAKIFAKYPLNK